MVSQTTWNLTIESGRLRVTTEGNKGCQGDRYSNLWFVNIFAIRSLVFRFGMCGLAFRFPIRR